MYAVYSFLVLGEKPPYLAFDALRMGWALPSFEAAQGFRGLPQAG